MRKLVENAGARFELRETTAGLHIFAAAAPPPGELAGVVAMRDLNAELDAVAAAAPATDVRPPPLPPLSPQGAPRPPPVPPLPPQGVPRPVTVPPPTFVAD